MNEMEQLQRLRPLLAGLVESFELDDPARGLVGWIPVVGGTFVHPLSREKITRFRVYGAGADRIKVIEPRFLRSLPLISIEGLHHPSEVCAVTAQSLGQALGRLGAIRDAVAGMGLVLDLEHDVLRLRGKTDLQGLSVEVTSQRADTLVVTALGSHSVASMDRARRTLTLSGEAPADLDALARLVRELDAEVQRATLDEVEESLGAMFGDDGAAPPAPPAEPVQAQPAPTPAVPAAETPAEAPAEMPAEMPAETPPAPAPAPGGMDLGSGWGELIPSTPTPEAASTEPAPEEAPPEVVALEEITPEEVTPEEVTPEEVTPEEVTPEVITQEVIAQEAVFPEAIVQEAATPDAPPPQVEVQAEDEPAPKTPVSVDVSPVDATPVEASPVDVTPDALQSAQTGQEQVLEPEPLESASPPEPEILEPEPLPSEPPILEPEPLESEPPILEPEPLESEPPAAAPEPQPEEEVLDLTEEASEAPAEAPAEQPAAPTAATTLEVDSKPPPADLGALRIDYLFEITGSDTEVSAHEGRLRLKIPFRTVQGQYTFYLEQTEHKRFVGFLDTPSGARHKVDVDLTAIMDIKEVYDRVMLS